MIKIMIKNYPNEDSNQIVKVLLVKDGKALLVHRPPGISFGDLWDLPGGHVKYGETLTQGLSREVKEETGLNVGRCARSYKASERNHTFFYCEDWSGELMDELPEHDDYAWVALDDIKDYKMGDFYRNAVRNLISSTNSVPIKVGKNES
jgi:8-oxo-dGTP diphosphatase